LIEKRTMASCFTQSEITMFGKTLTSAVAPQSCWFNGKLVPLERARVSVFDHGLLYGDGVFEGLRFYSGKAFRPDRHMKRLRNSLQALQIQIPYSDEALLLGIQHCIEAGEHDDGYLRLVVTRGEGSLGLDPKRCREPNVFILAAQLELAAPEMLAQGLTLITASVRRANGSGLDPRVKSLNYLHSILAKTEANHAGADDALLLNNEGRVAECSAANIFISQGKQLLTPPCLDGALGGITREAVMELAPGLGFDVRERSLSPWDIYNSDECFVTGSGARLMPVASLDGREIGVVAGPVFTEVLHAYQNLLRTELSFS
jgi:branched-chain amino acid aminotransferase